MEEENKEIEIKLDYIEETKDLMKASINRIGGTLIDDSPFSEYPEQIAAIIESSITPQSELDKLVRKSQTVNGEEI